MLKLGKQIPIFLLKILFYVVIAIETFPEWKLNFFKFLEHPSRHLLLDLSHIITKFVPFFTNFIELLLLRALEIKKKNHLVIDPLKEVNYHH